MNKDLLNILSNSNKDIDNQKLMDYLAGKLSATENNEIERLMAENDFMSDAADGLEAMKNRKHLEKLVSQLNTDLHSKLEKQKLRKEKRKLKEYPWIYVALVFILIMIVIVWFVIYRLQHVGH
jgi:hypothetical protein